MSTFVQYTVQGLAAGGFYALAALGLDRANLHRLARRLDVRLAPRRRACKDSPTSTPENR